MPLKSGFYKIAHTESGVRKYLYTAALNNSYEYQYSLQIGGTEAIQGADANSTIFHIEVESGGLRITAPRFNAEIRSNTSDNPTNWVTWGFWNIGNGSDRWEIGNETTLNGHVAGYIQIKGRSSEWGRVGFPSFDTYSKANLGKYSDTRWLFEFEPFVVEPGLAEGFYRFKNASTNKRLGNSGVHTYEQSDNGLWFKASWCGAEYGSAAMRLTNFESGESDLVTNGYSGINSGASVGAYSPENGTDGGAQVNHLWHYTEGKIGTSGSPAPSQVPSSISWPSYGAPLEYLGSVGTDASGIRMGRFTDGTKTDWIVEAFDKSENFTNGEYRLYNKALGGYLTKSGTFSTNQSDGATISVSNFRTDSRYGNLVDISGLPASNVLTNGAWVAGTEGVDTSKGFHITHLTIGNDEADTENAGIIWLGDWSDTVGLACGVSNDSQPVYGYAQKTFETFKNFLAPEITGTTVDPALDKSYFIFESIKKKVELTGEYQFAVNGEGSGITDGSEYGFDDNDIVYIKGTKSSSSSSVSLDGTHVASYLSTLTIDSTSLSFHYIDDGEVYYLESNSDKTVSTTLTPDATDTWTLYNVGYGTKKIDGQNRDGVAIYSNKQKAYLTFTNGTWMLQADPVCFWAIDINKRGGVIDNDLNVSIKNDFPISITPYMYDQQRIKYLWNDYTNKSNIKLKAKLSPSDSVSYEINLLDYPDWAMSDGLAIRQSIDNGLYLGDDKGDAFFDSSINEKTILALKICIELGGGSDNSVRYAAYITKPHSNVYLQYYGIKQPYFAKYGSDDSPSWFIIRYEIDQRSKIELNGNYAVVSAASSSDAPCIVNTKNRKTYPDNTSLSGQQLTIRKLGSFDGATDFWALKGLGNGISMICSSFVFDSIKWAVDGTASNNGSFWSYKTNTYGASLYSNGVVIHYEKKNTDGKPLFSIRPLQDLNTAATIDGNGEIVDGQQIVIKEYTGSDRQLWYFRKSDKLSQFPYRFRSFLDSTSIFGISGNSLSYGSIINNTAPNDTDNSTRIIPATIQDSTKNYFIFAHSGENIDDLGHGTEDNGANVCQWGIDTNYQGNQTWEYVPISSSDTTIGGYSYQSARIFNWRSENAKKLIDPSAGGTSISNTPLMWASRSDTDANKQAQYIVATPDCLYDATMPVASNIALLDDNGTVHDEQTISAHDMTWNVAFQTDDYNTGWSVAAEYRDVMDNGTTGEWIPIEIESYVETLGQDTYKEPKWGMAWSSNVLPNISDNMIIADTNIRIGGKDVGTGDITYIVAKQLRISIRSIAPSGTLTLRSYKNDNQYFDYIPTCGNTASKIFTIISNPSIDFKYFEAGADGLKIGYDSINIPSGFSLSITKLLTKSGDIKVHASEYNLPVNGTISIDWNDFEDIIPFGDDWPNNEITGFAYKIEYDGITSDREFYIKPSKIVLSANTYISDRQIALKSVANSLSAYLSDGNKPIKSNIDARTKYIVSVKYVYQIKFADRKRLVTNFEGIVAPQRTQKPDFGIWNPSTIEPERAMCFIFFNTGEINVIAPPTAGELIAPPRVGVSVFDFIDDDDEYHELHLIGNVGYTDAIDLDATEAHGSGSQFSKVYYGGGSTHQIQISGVIGINQPLTSDTFEANADDLNRLLYSRMAIYRTPFGGWHAVKVTGIEYGRDAARYSKVTVKMTEIDPDEISD